MENERKFTCCLCGKTFNGFGNNPYPVCDEDDDDSRCCDACDANVVIPLRIIKLRYHKIRQSLKTAKNGQE